MRLTLLRLFAIWLVSTAYKASSRISAIEPPRCQHYQKLTAHRRSLEHGDVKLRKRQTINPYSLLPAPIPTTFAQQIISEAQNSPVQAAKDVATLPYINQTSQTPSNFQLVNGDTDEAQLPQNAGVAFTTTPATTADAAGGWQTIPDLDGFTLNRSWSVLPGAVMPFYITAGFDRSQIKRAVITFPGKPRDAWKYANLYRNALNVVYANQSTFGVAEGSVLIVSPVWMNQLDQAAGGTKVGELYFHGSQWEAGGNSRGPNISDRMNTYQIMDNFTDMLFDRSQFPNLNHVVVGGHSMGGQAAHRYAILKRQKRYDNNMSFWVGNPGSWTYLSAERPFKNASCSSTFDQWHYGLGQNQTKISKYARADVIANQKAVVDRYLNRQVHMALGMLDNGAGDTHCEASEQGANHLDRGSRYILHLNDVNNGTFPPSQTIDFIGNTSHQDFGMISANLSLYWLFANNYNVRNPDIVPHNPGDKAKNLPKSNPKRKSYATHGNEAMASGLLGGSLILTILIFSIAPFVFRPNFEDQDLQYFANRERRYGRNINVFSEDFFNAAPKDESYGNSVETLFGELDDGRKK